MVTLGITELAGLALFYLFSSGIWSPVTGMEVLMELNHINDM